MFDDQLTRLLRPECLSDLPTFIKELITVLRTPDVQHVGTINVTLPDDSTDAPFTVDNFDPSGDVIRFNGRNGDPLTPFSGSTAQNTPQREQQRPEAYIGFVTGHSGGSLYRVAIYANGLNGGTRTVTARQMQIASGATIRIDGTVAAIVIKGKDGSYAMQVPVINRSTS